MAAEPLPPEFLKEEVVSRIVEEVLERFRYHGHRAWGDKSIVLGNPLWHPYFWADKQGSIASAAFGIAIAALAPIYFPAPMTISRMTVSQGTAGGAGTNLRLGLYADNGGTPQGGALLADSGNINANVTGVQTFTFAAPIAVRKGIPVWAALETENAVMKFRVCDDIPGFVEVGAEMMNGCFYTRGGGFGALTDPCPVVTSSASYKFWGFLRVDSVQPL